MTNADCYTMDTGNNSVLAIGRTYEEDKMIALFNFSEEEVKLELREEGTYADLVSGNVLENLELTMKGNSFFWLKRA